VYREGFEDGEFGPCRRNQGFGGGDGGHDRCLGHTHRHAGGGHPAGTGCKVSRQRLGHASDAVDRRDLILKPLGKQRVVPRAVGNADCVGISSRDGLFPQILRDVQQCDFVNLRPVRTDQVGGVGRCRPLDHRGATVLHVERTAAA
jgi:hypothetical protein